MATGRWSCLILLAVFDNSRYATSNAVTSATVVVPTSTQLLQRIEYTSQATRHAMLIDNIPIDTADPGTPSRFDFHDRAICGMRDNVNANNTGVVTNKGSNAMAATMALDNTTNRAITTRGELVRARTTARFINAEATVDAINEGDEMRMPWPSQAALEPVISTHIVRLTPWPWPRRRIFRTWGQACNTPSTAAMKPKTSAQNTQ